MNKNNNEQSTSNLIRHNGEGMNPSDEGIIKGRVAAQIARINQLVDKRLSLKLNITQIDKMSQLDDINMAKGMVAERLAKLNQTADKFILHGTVTARIAAINERLRAGKKIDNREERITKDRTNSY
ncbi:MAG: hypothetical protein ACC656_13125 [Candidatus Heimdallarchaeota archaeon]